MPNTNITRARRKPSNWPVVFLGIMIAIMLMLAVLAVLAVPAYRAVMCWYGGDQSGLVTEWDPIHGCTVTVLGTRVPVDF